MAGTRSIRRAAQIAARKKRRSTFVKIDFNQRITDFGKPVEITTLPRFIDDASILTKLPAEDAAKYIEDGGRYKLKEECREYMTLESIALQSLRTLMDGDERISPLDNYTLGKIGIKIYEANGEPVELSVEEIAALKPRISRIATPPVWAQACDMLDSKGKSAAGSEADNKHADTTGEGQNQKRRGRR
jgi:hypothetical protein